MILYVFKFQLDKIKTNRLVCFLLLITLFLVLYIGKLHHQMDNAIAYLLAMWLCVFFTDLLVLTKPPALAILVKRAKKESILFLICFVLGSAFLFIRFSGLLNWQELNPLLRLAFIPLLLFTFPIVLAIVLLIWKYKPRDLGMRFQGLLIVIPVILISFITNRLICPESLTYQLVLQESGGLLSALFSGFIVAGLSEEFFRFIGQSRLGAYFKNNAMAWFITTVLWAFMHAPKWYGDDGNLKEAILGSIRIIPIGLMWGYMTHRTKSILPSVIVHGSNFWGLQNF